ncbi:Mediator complex subunit 14 [Entamoeba marina]
MECSAHVLNFFDLFNNTIYMLKHQILKSFASHDRDVVINSLKCALHTLGKLIVLVRWSYRNTVLHDIDNFDNICQASISQLYFIVKYLIKSARRTIPLRQRCPEISVALQPLLFSSYPLPTIKQNQYDLNTIVLKTERRIWKYYYQHHSQIQCSRIDVSNGLFYIHVDNSFSCWLSVRNPDDVFTEKELNWYIVRLCIYTPFSSEVSHSVIDTFNKKLSEDVELVNSPFPLLINELHKFSKNEHLNCLQKEAKSDKLKSIFPNIHVDIVDGVTEKVLKVYYWENNQIHIDYSLDKNTNILSVSHVPSQVSNNFNILSSFENQILIAAKCAVEYINSLQTPHIQEVCKTNDKPEISLTISLFTGISTIFSPHLPSSLLKKYSQILTQNPFVNQKKIFEDIYLHAQYAKIYTIINLLFPTMNMEVIDDETFNNSKTYAKTRIKGELLLSESVDYKIADSDICGFPFKVSIPPERYLLFFLAKAPDYRLICLGVYNKAVNYSVFSKEIFVQGMECNVEKIKQICENCFSNFTQYVHINIFNENFNKHFSSQSTQITQPKGKPYYLFNRNLPFIINVECLADDTQFYLTVDFNNQVTIPSELFKTDTYLRLNEQKVMFCVPKGNIEDCVNHNIKRLNKFIHVISFYQKLREHVVWFNENTICFKGFQIEFKSEKFEEIIIACSLDEQHKHLSEFIKFHFLDSTEDEPFKKVIKMAERIYIQNGLINFVLYFEKLLNIFSLINKTGLSIVITEFISITFFINMEEQPASERNFSIVFSFNSKPREKSFSFMHRYIDKMEKKKFPFETFKETIKLIPNEFQLDDIEKHTKVLVRLIHYVILTDYVFQECKRSYESEQYKIIVRNDLFYLIPRIPSFEENITSNLLQNPSIDCLSSYFNQKYSNPLDSRDLIEAKRFGILLTKSNISRTCSDMSPLLLFSQESITQGCYKNVYDVVIQEYGNNNKAKIFLNTYQNLSHYQTKKIEPTVAFIYDTNSHQIVSADGSLQNNNSQHFDMSGISSMQQLVTSLKETFEK